MIKLNANKILMVQSYPVSGILFNESFNAAGNTTCKCLPNQLSMAGSAIGN